MSKKEKEETTSTDDLDKTIKLIEKSLGKGIVVDGQSILDADSQIIPISPALDIATSGGMPEGIFVNLSGPPKSGKTTLALHIAATAQRPEYGGREVFYIDIEGRLKKMNLNGIAGLNMKKFHAIRSKKEKILTGQEFLQTALDILKTQERCVVIVDSYSAVTHATEMEGGIGTSTRGAGAYTILPGFCRQASNILPVMRSNVIGILQMMANVGSPYGGQTEKGGGAVQYQSDIRLRIKNTKPWLSGTKQIGQEVNWQCYWSSLGPPNLEAVGYIRYGYGIDCVAELVQIALDFGVIELSGSWYTLSFEDKSKFQGLEKVVQGLKENPDLFNKVQEEVRKVLAQ